MTLFDTTSIRFYIQCHLFNSAITLPLLWLPPRRALNFATRRTSAELMHTHTPPNAHWHKKNNIAIHSHSEIVLSLSQPIIKVKLYLLPRFYIPRSHSSTSRGVIQYNLFSFIAPVFMGSLLNARGPVWLGKKWKSHPGLWSADFICVHIISSGAESGSWRAKLVSARAPLHSFCCGRLAREGSQVRAVRTLNAIFRGSYAGQLP